MRPVDNARPEYTTRLFHLTSELFLFLTSFRRKVRKGVPIEMSEASARLDEIFLNQARESRNDPKLEALYERARYPLVVLSDEILIHSGWEHADEWNNRLLEEKTFGSNIGGEKYFTIANELRPEETELAAILFAGIALGFGGKYRERPEKLGEVRQRLYRLNAEYLASTGDKITPAAYHVEPTAARRLSPLVNLYRLLIVAGGILILYYVLAFALWSNSLGEIRAAARAMGVE